MSGMQPLAPKALISQINANAAPQQAYNLMDPNTVPVTIPPPPAASLRSPIDQRSPSNTSQQSGWMIYFIVCWTTQTKPMLN